MKLRNFFYQNAQHGILYQIGYVKIFFETFVFFAVDYPWNYPSPKDDCLFINNVGSCWNLTDLACLVMLVRGSD